MRGHKASIQAFGTHARVQLFFSFYQIVSDPTALKIQHLKELKKHSNPQYECKNAAPQLRNVCQNEGVHKTKNVHKN